MGRAGAVVIANAIIWAGVILAVAFRLKGTDSFSQIMPVLGGGAAISIILVGGGLGSRKNG